MDNKRRRRFVAYFSGPPLNGDRAQLIKKTHLTKGRVSQLFDEAQPFGERAAEHLAQALGLPNDYFEADRTASQPVPDVRSIQGALELSDRERDLIRAFRYLPPLEQDELYTHAVDRATTLRQHVETLLRERFAANGLSSSTPAEPEPPPQPRKR